MQRAEKIDVIIAKRKEKSLVVDGTLSRLDNIEEQVKSFDGFRKVFAAANDESIQVKIQELDPFFNDVFTCLSLQKTNLRKVKSRFTRETINIGITGQARQGKSTFLQQLTGLSEGEIPTGDKGHCTGAPSFIVHKDVEKTYAELTFFSESSFVEEVLKPYFKELSNELGGFQPQSLDDFKTVILPEIQEATKTGYIEKLKKLQANIDLYRSLLTGVSGQRIEQHQIREYVAQENEEGTQKYFKWVAVQQAKIFCKFPQADLGRIQIGDTPGLGDFICGAEDRLIENIGAHLDVAVLLRKPEAKGAILKREDSDLYDLIKKANPSIELKDWSYLVLNLSEDNQSGADFFKQQWLDHGNGNGSMKVRDILAINCKQTSSVHDGFDQMISDMVNNLERVDQVLYEKLLDDFSALRTGMANLISAAQAIIPKSTGNAENGTFEDIFEGFYDDLMYGLRNELLEPYRERRRDYCMPLVESLNMIYTDLELGAALPEVDLIKREKASTSDARWFYDTLDHLRNKFLRQFDPLDKCLEEVFNTLRRQVIGVFISEKYGKLGGLLPYDSSIPIKSWFDRFCECWEEGEDYIRPPVDVLLNTGMVFRGFMLPRIRQCLDDLDSNIKNPTNPYNYESGDSIERMCEKLNGAWIKAYNAARDVIEEEDIMKEPSECTFSLLQEFGDRIAASARGRKSESKWRRFYSANRGDVWPDVFGRLEENSRMRKEWEAHVATLGQLV